MNGVTFLKSLLAPHGRHSEHL